MPGSSTYTFGPFRLDAAKKRLARGDEPVALSEHQLDVLLRLVTAAGEVISKNALIDAGWPRLAVTDNSLEQAISALRRTLGDKKLIETVPRRGYRFRGEVQKTESRATDEELAALLEPYREWVEGRTELETLERDGVLRAEQAFTDAVARSPAYAPAHVGLANAAVTRFVSTRADELPDADALLRAGHHAREACRLDAQSGEAWATLALVLHRSGMGVQAIAAARRAVMLEPDNWRHHFRLAYVGWGEERLRAVQQTLQRFPDFALARWLAATVYVARQAFDLAEQELRAGAAAQDAQQGTHGPFISVGSHWLLGLVLMARGREEDGLEELRRELTFESLDQLYSRECCANTWYSIGALLLRKGRRADAIGAFEHALERVPAHLLSMAGLSIALEPSPARETLHDSMQKRVAQLGDAGFVVDAALGRAALHAGNGAPDDAARVLDEALSAAPSGNAGWQVPVDPLLNVPAHEPSFVHVLARLRTRAA